MRARRRDDLRRGIAFVIDAHGIPTATSCCRAVVFEIIEEKNFSGLRACFALKRAVNRAAWLLETKKMRRVPMRDRRKTRQFNERVPMAIIRVRQARCRGARIAQRSQRVRNTWILANKNRIMRAQNRLAINARAECRVRCIKPRIKRMLAALMHRNTFAKRNEFFFANLFKHIRRHTNSMQSVGERSSNAHDHSTEVDADKCHWMA
jgi:hypothetical protein